MQSERLLSAPAPEATVSNWPPPPPPCDRHMSLVAESSLVASGAASAVSCGMTTRRASSPAAFIDGAPGLPPSWLRENGGGDRNGGGEGKGGSEGSGGDGDGRDGRESPGSLPSSSSSFSLSSSSAVSCPPASRAKLAGGRDGGRLAWCGDQRLLPRPSATLQLRRHNSSSSGSSLGGTTSASQSTTAAAYLGRLNLSADSAVAGGGGERGGDGAAWGGLGQLPVNGGWGDASLGGGLGYVRAAPAAAAAEGGGDGSGVGRDDGAGGRVGGANGAAGGGYSADDAVTLSSSGLSVTSGEESDGDEVFMEVDDRDDPNFDYGALEDDDLSPADASSPGVGSESAGAGARTGAAAEPGTVAVTAGGDLIAEGGAGAVAGVVVAVAGTVAGGAGLRDGGASAAAAGGGHPPSRGMAPRGKGKGKKRCAKKTTKISDGVAPEPIATREAEVGGGDGGVGGGEVAAVGDGGVDAKQAPIRARSRRAKGPVVPKQPPSGPRKWPPRPRHRALVYAAAAEASRRVRGFTGWVFPALPPPPPPRPRPPTPPPPVVEEEEEAEPPPVEETEEGEGSNTECGAEGKAGRVKELSRKEKIKQREKNMFLGFAKDNPPGKPSPNELGWLPIDPMLTREGRAAAKKRALERRRAALERIAERKRQEILEALRIKVHDVCATRW